MKVTASVVSVTGLIMLGDSGIVLAYLLTASPVIIKDGSIILMENVKLISLEMLASLNLPNHNFSRMGHSYVFSILEGYYNTYSNAFDSPELISISLCASDKNCIQCL